jgi:hypothetical protein
MGNSRILAIALAGAPVALPACERAQAPPPLFELLDPEATGVTFVNELPLEPELNILNSVFYYNGGGVAVGDIDGDGLPDLYFTSNLGRDRLYRNKGNYQFEDITDRAGVGRENSWSSGATMADVDGDGHIDIYVSAVKYLTLPGGNTLYINNGDGTFTDRTAEFGLEHAGYSTQATFFDYDADGDLDMYLLNYSTPAESAAELMVATSSRREARHPLAGDRLFRNEGDRFVDVSDEAGIFGGAEGFGLGVVASDLNDDGCVDLFVANDFQENDFLYFNNCDGTFTESSARALGHTSRFSMGVDAADFNNDGLLDLVVLDMLPEREDILKTSSNAENFVIANLKLRAGYGVQYARNTLQLNRGGGRFSEIGQLAGIHATDWSWAPLFADLDNDGYKDLFVTNGIYRRPNDLDHVSRMGSSAIQASLNRGITKENLTLVEQMPQVPIPNYAYRNNGDLTFTNVAESWGLAQPGFSSGAAYVDLNNSGALDLVINNVNASASIYRNLSPNHDRHYLKVLLHGSESNTAGIGAKVVIRIDGVTQLVEQAPTRGFQSSVDSRLHFGLGSSERVDSLLVIWPDHRFQVLTDVPADQTITLSQDRAGGAYDYRRGTAGERLFADIGDRLGLNFEHEENSFYDYSREPLMPHRLSTEGPPIAVGDVNGDGLDDVYIGGAKGQAGSLFLQSGGGTFRARDVSAFRADSLHEDTDAIFFDADGDGHLDLFVVSGGNEFWGEHEALRDRIYMNDGRGYFRRDDTRLPDLFENGSCVVPADFNRDGHVDLFVGSRVVARSYGLIPESHLLQNDGRGKFADVTLDKASALARAGMVSAATWTDYDGNGELDLIVVGEWMPIRVFSQEKGRFVDRTREAGLSETSGWWNAVLAADLDGDGREDLVLGNLGLNSQIRASPDEPARLYVHDFYGDGTLEQILTFYKRGVSYPLAGRDELTRAMPALRGRFLSYADFGDSRIEEFVRVSELEQATVLEARSFASATALNNGDGTFAVRELPMEAQFAPVYAMLAEDFDGDGYTDLLVAGNFHGVPPVRGRYDASYGQVLRGDGRGRFEPIDMHASGLIVEGEVRDMELLRVAGGDRLIVIARNDDTLALVSPLRRKVSAEVARFRVESSRPPPDRP